MKGNVCMKKLILIVIVPLLVGLGTTAQAQVSKTKREEKIKAIFHKRRQQKLKHDILTHDIKQYRRKQSREKNIKVYQIVSYKKKETKADKKVLRKSRHAIARLHKKNNKEIKQNLIASNDNSEFFKTSLKKRKQSHNEAFGRAKRKTARARRHDEMAIVIK